MHPLDIAADWKASALTETIRRLFSALGYLLIFEQVFHPRCDDLATRLSLEAAMPARNGGFLSLFEPAGMSAD